MSQNDTIQPTNQDILTAINEFATDITSEVHEFKQDMYSFKQDMDGFKQGMYGFKQGMQDFKSQVNDRLGKIESTMVTKEEFKQELVKVVTKEYLDDKLFDLRGDLTVLLRKEDQQVTALVDTLHSKKVLSTSEAEHILALKPFARSTP